MEFTEEQLEYIDYLRKREAAAIQENLQLKRKITKLEKLFDGHIERLKEINELTAWDLFKEGFKNSFKTAWFIISYIPKRRWKKNG